MASELGHTIVTPRPALSALVTTETWVPALQGLALKNVEAKLMAEKPETNKRKIVEKEFGEMLFTHCGISGPVILRLSRKVPDLLSQGKVYIGIDLKPALTHEQLHARLIRDFKQSRHFKNYLHELLPRSMIEVFPGLCQVAPDKPLNQISAGERHRIVDTLKELLVTVRGMRPLEEAIVTAGGISLKEIDPKTMMSKLVEGLFFAGEVIDIDAETGGFNLQAAFSTGFVAGKAAAEFAAAPREGAFSYEKPGEIACYG